MAQPHGIGKRCIGCSKQLTDDDLQQEASAAISSGGKPTRAVGHCVDCAKRHRAILKKSGDLSDWVKSLPEEDPAEYRVLPALVAVFACVTHL